MDIETYAANALYGYIRVVLVVADLAYAALTGEEPIDTARVLEDLAPLVNALTVAALACVVMTSFSATMNRIAPDGSVPRCAEWIVISILLYAITAAVRAASGEHAENSLWFAAAAVLLGGALAAATAVFVVVLWVLALAIGRTVLRA